MGKTTRKPATKTIDPEVFERQLQAVLGSPQDAGIVELIISRPREGERQRLERARLSPEAGVEGDRWLTTSWKKFPDGTPDPAVQVTLMNARCIRSIAGDMDNWAEAGDNLFVDLDLSRSNLPTGSRLTIGSCVLEITKVPHNGCWKFKKRFGEQAVQFVNAPARKPLRLRGIHARVLQAGMITVGDRIQVSRP